MWASVNMFGTLTPSSKAYAMCWLGANPSRHRQRGIPPANTSTGDVLWRILEWLFLWAESHSLECWHFRCKENSKDKRILGKSKHYNSNLTRVQLHTVQNKTVANWKITSTLVLLNNLLLWLLKWYLLMCLFFSFFQHIYILWPKKLSEFFTDSVHKLNKSVHHYTYINGDTFYTEKTSNHLKSCFSLWCLVTVSSVHQLCHFKSIFFQQMEEWKCSTAQFNLIPFFFSCRKNCSLYNP